MSNSEKTSIFTPQRTVKYFFVEFIGIGIASVIIWPLIDLLFTAIDHKDFIWSIKDHIVFPIIFALIFTAIEFIFWKRFHKETKK